ncbi:MAG: efflux RND transporter permease subunit, partial [candidate division Zixibacteria bacterium]|nr:efflux RND transporter permease subunit [candidate division Zixibacteria bacterium]
MVRGLASLLFHELILVIACIMAISLVMAIAVTPIVMALVLGRRAAYPERLTFTERLIERVTDSYSKLLTFSIRGRWATITIFIAMLLIGTFLPPCLGTEFLPKMDDGRVMVKHRLPTGASVEQTSQSLAQVESAVAGDKLIDNTFTLVGGRVWGLYTYEVANEGEIDIQLVERGKRRVSTDQYIKQLDQRLVGISLTAGKAMVMQQTMKGIRKIGNADIEVKVKGQDAQQLYAMANGVAQSMQQLGQFKNVYVSMDM